MTRRMFSLLSATALFGLMLSFSPQAMATGTAAELAGKESPVTAAEKEKPIKQDHLKASPEEMKAIKKCAKKMGVPDVESKNMTEEQKKTVNQCYRDVGVVPPDDLKEYDTMKGQYY